MTDALGDRMKGNYEGRTQQHLMRRAYTIMRIDGKAFHTYTRSLEKPFDKALMEDMDSTAAYLCKNIGGAKFAFVQSDEISLLLTDFDTLQTDAWFDNNVQKMVSVSASLATSKFNHNRLLRKFERAIVNNQMDCYVLLGKAFSDAPMAHFDSRVFQVPNKSEAENYFIWRQQDATRNSISSAAQALYSPKELHGVNTSQMHDLMHAKGVNWNDYDAYFKRGRVIVKEEYQHPVLGVDTAHESAEDVTVVSSTRTRWVMKEVPIFTQERQFISDLIPENL